MALLPMFDRSYRLGEHLSRRCRDWSYTSSKTVAGSLISHYKRDAFGKQAIFKKGGF